jgi:hypothetical protein
MTHEAPDIGEAASPVAPAQPSDTNGKEET